MAKIMRRFKLKEISCVGSPAQEGATMVLMKAHEPDRDSAVRMRTDIADHDRRLREFERMMKTKSDRGEQEKFEKVTPAGYDTFEDAVRAIAKAEGMPAHEAMSRVARTYSSLLRSYNDAGRARVEKALETMQSPTRSPAIAEWDALVTRIKARDMCPATTALRRARVENPELFTRYQEA